MVAKWNFIWKKMYTQKGIYLPVPCMEETFLYSVDVHATGRYLKRFCFLVVRWRDTRTSGSHVKRVASQSKKLATHPMGVWRGSTYPSLVFMRRDSSPLLPGVHMKRFISPPRPVRCLCDKIRPPSLISVSHHSPAILCECDNIHLSPSMIVWQTAPCPFNGRVKSFACPPSVKRVDKIHPLNGPVTRFAHYINGHPVVVSRDPKCEEVLPPILPPAPMIAWRSWLA